MRLRRPGARLLLVTLLAGPVLGACGGGEPDETAGDLLARAEQTLDAAETAHFVLTSEDAPDTGTLLVGGEGDIARPASFQVTLKVRTLGLAVDLDVV